MGVYEQREQELQSLHKQIVSDINDTIAAKGYGVGDLISTGFRSTIEVMNDRTLINGSHTDNLSADELLKTLRDVLRMRPKG